MRLFLKSLYLKNFRNYKERVFAFHPQLNVITGPNARGKTNLLEAISLLSTGRSFRTEKLSELVLQGESFFYLEAEVVKDSVAQTLSIAWQNGEKKLRINATEFKTFTPLLGAFPFIVSAPEDTQLITEEPAVRRRFLNFHLAQRNLLYVHHLSRFWNAMQERNALLKARKDESIECFEEQMAHSSEFIHEERKRFLQNLQKPLDAHHQKLSAVSEGVATEFISTYPTNKASYQQHLHKMRYRERELGITLHGPHRDDVSFLLQSRSAKTFASEGQKKTLVTALRLAQWEDLSQKMSEAPFFAVDDFGGALDEARQHALKNSLHTMGQVFVSMPMRSALFQNAHFLEI